MANRLFHIILENQVNEFSFEVAPLASQSPSWPRGADHHLSLFLLVAWLYFPSNLIHCILGTAESI